MEEEEWVDVDLAVGGQMEDPDITLHELRGSVFHFMCLLSFLAYKDWVSNKYET